MPPIYADLQEFVEQVPTLLQFPLVALVAMVPYVEGEGASAFGIIAGLHPVLAGTAAAVGNFVSVVLVVLLGSRIRGAVVARRARATEGNPTPRPVREQSKGRRRLERWVTRFGVPGASLLAPLALPTQLTAVTFIASGVSRRRVLLWQGIAIVLWTTAVTLAATGALRFLTT